MTYKLSDLACPSSAHIAALDINGAMRRRLLDLGFVPGAEVRVLYAGFRNGIRAYAVGGSVFALRRSDAAGIRIEQ